MSTGRCFYSVRVRIQVKPQADLRAQQWLSGAHGIFTRCLPVISFQYPGIETLPLVVRRVKQKSGFYYEMNVVRKELGIMNQLKSHIKYLFYLFNSFLVYQMIPNGELTMKSWLTSPVWSDLLNYCGLTPLFLVSSELMAHAVSLGFSCTIINLILTKFGKYYLEAIKEKRYLTNSVIDQTSQLLHYNKYLSH